MSNPLQFVFGRLHDFSFDALKPNFTNSTDSRVPIVFTTPNEEKLLSSITIYTNENDSVVWLFGTLGFTVNTQTFLGSIIFKIWRGKPSEGNLIFSTTDTIQGGTNAFTSRNSSFTVTDYIHSKVCNKIIYSLTAEITLEEPQTVTDVRLIGPITFLAGAIENN